jgi:hypothetical protein
METVNNRFKDIESLSHRKFKSFDSAVRDLDNYYIDIDNSLRCTFQLGFCEWTILPVLTYFDNPNTENCTVRLFGASHPTGFSYPELDKCISKLGLPTKYTGTYNVNAKPKQNEMVHERDSGFKPTAGFRFAYKVTALVCNEVRGSTFVNVKTNTGSLLWFVVLNPTNKYAQLKMKIMETKKKQISDIELNKWHKYLGL